MDIKKFLSDLQPWQKWAIGIVTVAGVYSYAKSGGTTSSSTSSGTTGQLTTGTAQGSSSNNAAGMDNAISALTEQMSKFEESQAKNQTAFQDSINKSQTAFADSLTKQTNAIANQFNSQLTNTTTQLNQVTATNQALTAALGAGAVVTPPIYFPPVAQVVTPPPVQQTTSSRDRDSGSGYAFSGISGGSLVKSNSQTVTNEGNGVTRTTDTITFKDGGSMTVSTPSNWIAPH